MWTRWSTDVIWQVVIRCTPPDVIIVMDVHSEGLSKIGHENCKRHVYLFTTYRKVSVYTRTESLEGVPGLSVHRWLSLALLNLSFNVIGSAEAESLEECWCSALTSDSPQSQEFSNNAIETDGTERLAREVAQDPAGSPQSRREWVHATSRQSRWCPEFSMTETFFLD
jgi:hypothetical protein